MGIVLSFPCLPRRTSPLAQPTPDATKVDTRSRSISHPYPLAPVPPSRGSSRRPSPSPIPSHRHWHQNRMDADHTTTTSEISRPHTHVQSPSDEIIPPSIPSHHHQAVARNESPRLLHDYLPPRPPEAHLSPSIRTHTSSPLFHGSTGGRKRLTKPLRVEGDWDMLRASDWTGFRVDIANEVERLPRTDMGMSDGEGLELDWLGGTAAEEVAYKDRWI